MTIAEEFKRDLDYLFETKGLKLSAIAKAIDVSPNKIKSIRANRSSGDAIMLENLRTKFKTLLNGEKPQIDPADLLSRIEQLEKDNALLKELVLQNLQQQRGKG